LLGATWQDHSDRENGNGTTLKPSGYESRAVDLKWSTVVGETGDLSFTAQALEQPSTPRTDELVPGYGQTEPASEQFLFQPNKRNFMHVRWQSESNMSWLDGYQLNLARQEISDDRITQDTGVPEFRSEQNKSTADSLTMQFDSATAGGTQMTWGLEFYTDEIRSQRKETDIESGDTEIVRSRFPDGSSMDSRAVYWSAEWHPIEDLVVGTGVRYSSFDIELAQTSSSPEARLAPDDLTGDISFVYTLSPATNLVANIGRGFRPPNVFDLGTLGSRPGNRFNIANPDLKPESVHSFDLGFKVESGQFRSEAFLFMLDYRDKISSVATGELTESGRVIVRSDNVAEARIYGVETGFRWLQNDAMEWYGTLNYTRGTESAEGEDDEGDRIPPLNGRLGLSWHSSEALELDTFLEFAGRQDRLSGRDIRDPRINPDGSPGWVTFNILLNWSISEKVNAGLRLENLGDQHYREHGSGIDAPGRNIGAWLSINF
jgi:outer membrane receptor protein involved in Fe transport